MLQRKSLKFILQKSKKVEVLELHCVKNFAMDDIKTITELKNLTNLDLSYNSIINNNTLGYLLVNIKNIHELHLSHCSAVREIQLKESNSSLSILDLSCTDITDTSILSILVLEIVNTKITSKTLIT